jgi:hypothetical protein
VTKADKILERMRGNPTGWRIEDLQAVADRNDVVVRKGKGSHVVFIANDGQRLTVPAKRPIKPVYVRAFVTLVEGT